MSDPVSDPIHERVQELLAWWVNGTLDREETQLVAEHLEACAECRRDEAHCRALAGHVSAAEEVAPMPHPARLERLLAKASPRARVFRPRLPRWLLGAEAPVRWALAVQTMLLVMLATALFWRSDGHTQGEARAAVESPAAGYRTLEDVDRAGRVATVRVVFAADTPEQELRRIVLVLGGELVAGPTPLGAYTLALPVGAGADPIPVVVEHLRSLPTVRFAEPIAGGNEQVDGAR